MSTFRTLGYQIFPRIIPAASFSVMKLAVPKAVHARSAVFLSLPSPSDVLTQEVRHEDPMVSSLRRKFAQHKQERKKRRKLVKRRRQILLMKHKQVQIRKAKSEAALAAAAAAQQQSTTSSSSSTLPDASLARKRKNPSLASASDISSLSKRIAEQLASLNPAQSSIENDPQRLQAINVHCCNLWMTDPELAKVVHSEEFGKRVLGRIARETAGIESPVLFCDRPVFQLPFGRPALMHFAAPFLGVEQVVGVTGAEQESSSPSSSSSSSSSSPKQRRPNAVAVWVPLNPAVSIRVMERSHTLVESRMRDDPKKLDPRLFRLDFRAVDSNNTLWARRFPELLYGNSSGSTTRSAAAIHSAQQQQQQQQQPAPERKSALEIIDLPPGSAVAFDPFTFAAVAPNVTLDEQAVMQFLVVSATDCRPSVHPYSWVREWKSSSLHVDFKNSVVFPKLF